MKILRCGKRGEILSKPDMTDTKQTVAKMWTAFRAVIEKELPHLAQKWPQINPDGLIIFFFQEQGEGCRTAALPLGVVNLRAIENFSKNHPPPAHSTYKKIYE